MLAGCDDKPILLAEQHREADALIARINTSVTRLRSVPITSEHAPWVIMHGIYAFGDGWTIQDAPSTKPVTALQWASAAGADRLFMIWQNGVRQISASSRSPHFRLADHPDQWLFIFSERSIPLSLPIAIGNSSATVQDLLGGAKLSVNRHAELIWSVTALANYRVAGTWKNTYGEDLSLDDLARSLLNMDWRNTPCGGTHYLYAAARLAECPSIARATRQQLRAFLAVSVDRAKRSQSPQGTWTPNWVHDTPDKEELGGHVIIQTTGHQLEWLALAVNDQELLAGWMTEAVRRLTDVIDGFTGDPSSLANEAKVHPEVYGVLCHASHGLELYRARISE